MRGRLLALLSMLCCACGDGFVPAGPQGPSPNPWSRSFGDTMSQRALAVAVDAFGNVYVTGSFEGVITVGDDVLTANGGEDVFVVKYDTDGTAHWCRRYGADGDQRGTALALDSAGNLILAGNFAGSIDIAGSVLQAQGASDVFATKLSPEGEPLFTASFAGTGAERAWAVAAGADGDVVLGGDFDADLDLGGGLLVAAGDRDMFLVKLSPELAPRWSKRFGEGLEDVLLGIDVSVSRSIALTGYARSPLDFGGNVLPPAGAEPNEDAFVAVLDEHGEHVWSRRIGDVTSQRGYAVRYDGEDLLVVGSFGGIVDFGGIEHVSSSSYDVFVVKYDDGGRPRWVRSYGVSGDQQGYRVVADRQRNVFVAGDFQAIVGFGGDQLQSAGEWDVFLAKLDADGNHLASRRYGDGATQHLADLAVDTAGHPIVVGSYFGAIDFGFGAHESAGLEDPFVAKMLP